VCGSADTSDSELLTRTGVYLVCGVGLLLPSEWVRHTVCSGQLDRECTVVLLALNNRYNTLGKARHKLVVSGGATFQRSKTNS